MLVQSKVKKIILAKCSLLEVRLSHQEKPFHSLIFNISFGLQFSKE